MLPRPPPPSTPPSKRGKKGPLRKMKAHQKAIKKRKLARITARYNTLAEHYLQQVRSSSNADSILEIHWMGGSAHPEEVRNRCLKIIHDMAVDGDNRDNPSVKPKKKEKQTGDSVA
ncbi:hypothetical protein N7530_004722 [Penicillium desertorum]|uniref:Uncharacterized protein n=1 Tax=Penicillium desertorum TaxID=1303715 RepID=A0A9X0BQT5_9EURO|nr:hypothetical protein N7530_004722 [Penicillium desertorum]